MAKSEKVRKFDLVNKESDYAAKFVDYLKVKKDGDKVDIADVATKINVSVGLAKDLYIKNISKIPRVEISLEKPVKVVREHPYMNSLKSVMIGVPFMAKLNNSRIEQNLPAFVENDEFEMTTDTNRIILTKIQ